MTLARSEIGPWYRFPPSLIRVREGGIDGNPTFVIRATIDAIPYDFVSIIPLVANGY
jgi:hypothetical protein